MSAFKNPIICALDTTDVAHALELTKNIGKNIGGIKLGLEFFVANGAKGVRKLTDAGLPVFLDLKFHDIPNTVAGAVRAATELNVAMLTIHTGGGRDMMKAAKEAAQETADKLGITPPLILGVTVLTSMGKDDLNDLGLLSSIYDQVFKLTQLADDAGLDGVVCSPKEITSLRRGFGEDLTLVVPGIRPAGSDVGDQKRVMTPEDAIDDGANYLVIGRPISQAKDPAQAAKDILDSIS